MLHDWPDHEAGRILANIATAGGSGARLLVLDFVVPSGDTPHLAKISDLNMLAMVGGKERTESEWRELLTAAGFASIEVRPPAHHLQSIQATAQRTATRTDQPILSRGPATLHQRQHISASATIHSAPTWHASASAAARRGRALLQA